MTTSAFAVTTTFVSRETTTAESMDEMRARIAMLEASLAAERERSKWLEAERDKLREAQLELEAKKKELDELAGKLAEESSDAPQPKVKRKPKGRRDLKARRDLPVESVVIPDASMELMVADGAAERNRLRGERRDQVAPRRHRDRRRPSREVPGPERHHRQAVGADRDRHRAVAQDDHQAIDGNAVPLREDRGRQVPSRSAAVSSRNDVQ